MKFLHLFIALLSLTSWMLHAGVRFEPLPEFGLQPQVADDGKRGIHLVYLVGNPKSSDVIYRHRVAHEAWSERVQVNSQPGSAIAIGTIRGAQLAVDKSGRVHVAWNGSQSAEPKPAMGGTPMLYSKQSANGKDFMAQVNLMTRTHDLDGGGSIATGAGNEVYVFFHAASGGIHGETNRAVYLALSTDGGAHFDQEKKISPINTGACGCCGLAAFSNENGEPSVLFRSARTVMQRDMVLLAAIPGKTGDFREVLSDPWLVGACPMSSPGFARGNKFNWAAWETDGQIQLARTSSIGLTPKTLTVGPRKGSKHPRIAVNHRGEVLIVWAEGTGWERGGSIGWQVLDSEGNKTGQSGHQEGLPPWTFATCYSTSEGEFVITY